MRDHLWFAGWILRALVRRLVGLDPLPQEHGGKPVLIVACDWKGCTASRVIVRPGDNQELGPGGEGWLKLRFDNQHTYTAGFDLCPEHAKPLEIAKAVSGADRA